MSRRLSAILTIAALLVLHLGVACLAVMQAHAAMPMDESPCDANAATAQLLCQSPADLAPPAGPALVLDGLATLLPAPAVDTLAAYAGALDEPQATSPLWPPAFLLHRALLI